MKTCPYCAEAIEAEAAVCRFCGRDLAGLPDGGPASDSPRRRPRGLYAAVGVLLLLAVILGAIVLALNAPEAPIREPPSGTPSAGPTPVPVPPRPLPQPGTHLEPAIEVDLGGGLTMRMVSIPPGTFTMGSPAGEKDRHVDEVQHEVTITKPFYLGIHEVTRAQFARFVSEARHRTDAEKAGWAYAWTGKTWGKVNGASWKAPGFQQNDDHPVTEISWNDAAAFCQWLSRKGQGTVRLPTEAEWEYACRAGTSTVYHWGNSPDDGKGWCNWADAEAKAAWGCSWGVTWSDGHAFTAPVGSFRPNAWGLCDMRGNVWEWCADWYGAYPPGRVTDPTGPAMGTFRVLRGGSWNDKPWFCRSATRFSGTPSERGYDSGFRCARTVVP